MAESEVIDVWEDCTVMTARVHHDGGTDCITVLIPESVGYQRREWLIRQFLAVVEIKRQPFQSDEHFAWEFHVVHGLVDPSLPQRQQWTTWDNGLLPLLVWHHHPLESKGVARG